MVDAIELLSAWVDILIANSLLAAIVIGVVLVLTKIAPRRGAAIHAALWGLVLIRLVLPPDLGHPLASGALLDRLFHSEGVAVPLSGGGNEEPLFLGNRSEIPPHKPRTAAESLLPVVGILWLVGFLAAAAVQIRRLHAVQRVLSGGTPARDPDVLAECENWRRRLRVRRRVIVITSETSLTPFTVGVFRPVIFLPQAVVMNRLCLEAAVAHEMAHVARLDAVWLRLQQLVQTVYFFNPLVWFAGARFDDAREQLCDETVVAADRLAARDYVGGLLDVLRLELQGIGAPAMTTTRKGRIGVRIRNIFEREGGSQPKVGAAVLLAAAVGVFLLPFGSAGADSPTAPAAAMAEHHSSASTPGEPVRLSNPLPEGRVTWGWGPGHLDPFTHKKVSHTGIDLAAPTGTRVVAPANGVVRVATENYGVSPAAGTVILIDHANGLSTFFAHLHSLEVVEGQRVERGAVVGTVGSTGKSTGPHLHFEVRRDGESADPAEFVEEWRK